MPVLALFGLMLIIMLMRVALPIGARVDGKIVHEIRLSFRERLLVQRTNVYLIGGTLLLGSLAGWLPVAVELVIVVGVFAVLAIPVRYIVTDQGVALNHVVFRPWREFGSFADERGGLRLRGLPGYRDFRLVGTGARRAELRRAVESAMARTRRLSVDRKGVTPAALPRTTATPT